MLSAGVARGGEREDRPISPMQSTTSANNDKEKLYVGNVPNSCTKRDLEDLFGHYGPLLSVEVKHGGFAFIEFKHKKDADDAVVNLHRYLFQGKQLIVEVSVRKGNLNSDGCLVCGEVGHWARSCPSNLESTLDIKSGKCFKCGVSGHLAKFCRADNRSADNRGDDRRPDENERSAPVDHHSREKVVRDRDSDIRDHRDRHVDYPPRATGRGGDFSNDRRLAAASRYPPREEHRDRPPFIDYGRERDFDQRSLPLAPRRPRSPPPSTHFSNPRDYYADHLDQRYGQIQREDFDRPYHRGGAIGVARYDPYDRRSPMDASRRIPPPEPYYPSYERGGHYERDDRRGYVPHPSHDRRGPIDRR